MAFIVLPTLLPASVYNASGNARIISEWMRDNDVEIHGRQRSGGLRCLMWGDISDVPFSRSDISNVPVFLRSFDFRASLRRERTGWLGEREYG